MKIVTVIDAQNDFVKEGFLFGSKQNEEKADKIVKFLEDRKSGEEKIFINFTQDYHDKDVYKTLVESSAYPIHCVPDTEGFEIVSQLKPYSLISFRKNSFGSIELANTILIFCNENKTEDIEIEIVGFCFDICVLSFAILLRSMLPEHKITVYKDLCGSSKSDETYAKCVEEIYKANAIEVKEYSKGE